MSQMIQDDEVPWSDKLIMVCSKCGVKVSASPTDPNVSERIKSDLKSQIFKDQRKSQIRAVTSSCLDVCPEGRIAIVEVTRGPQPQTSAVTVDPKISAEELKKKFLR